MTRTKWKKASGKENIRNKLQLGKSSTWIVVTVECT